VEARPRHPGDLGGRRRTGRPGHPVCLGRCLRRGRPRPGGRARRRRRTLIRRGSVAAPPVAQPTAPATPARERRRACRRDRSDDRSDGVRSGCAGWCARRCRNPRRSRSTARRRRTPGRDPRRERRAKPPRPLSVPGSSVSRCMYHDTQPAVVDHDVRPRTGSDGDAGHDPRRERVDGRALGGVQVDSDVPMTVRPRPRRRCRGTRWSPDPAGTRGETVERSSARARVRSSAIAAVGKTTTRERRRGRGVRDDAT
jgi:hypothetical protein